MKCANPECSSVRVVAKGYCSGCYSRLNRRGTLDRAYMRGTVACSVPGCDRKPFSKGMCAKHYQQADHPLKAVWKNLRKRADSSYPAEWDRFEAFLDDVGERPSEKCQLRRLDKSKPWSAANCAWREPVGVDRKTGLTANMADYQRAWSYLRKFGLRVDDIARMRKAQDDKCGICTKVLGVPHPDTGKIARICVDHDHKTGAVRELLCDWCNKGLGQFDDSIDRLRAAIAYLERHGAESP